MFGRIQNKLICGFSVSFAILAVLIVSFSQSQQRGVLPNEFEIQFDKPQAVIPCRCEHEWHRVIEKAALQISVVTSTAVRGPLTYRYSIAGGGIIGEGPIVVWDYDGLAPGDYQLAVDINDGSIGLSKQITKTIRLLESPECDCPQSCPTLQIRSDKKAVKPGEKVTFHLSMLGGDTLKTPLHYNWSVTGGRVGSGQDTAEVTVISDRHPKNREVSVAVEINGLNPAANCPSTSSDSVDFGPRSIEDESARGWVALLLDEQLLTLACPPGRDGCHERSSPDMLVDVYFETMKRVAGSKVIYKVSAGNIIGTGDRVRWDLSNTPPGTYVIEASEWRNGKPYGEKRTQTVNIVSAMCICDPSCPIVSIHASERQFEPGETIDISASISGGSQDMPIMYNWTTSEGEIDSGQSSHLIRIKLPSTAVAKRPVVTLTIGGLDPRWACPNSTSKEINLKSIQ